MPFEWTVLEPVRLRVDTRGLRGVELALAMWPDAARKALRRALQETGAEINEAIRENLSGKVLGRRSGRLLGSWVSGMVDDLTWAGHSRVGYGALWERGFTQRAGIFPVRLLGGGVVGPLPEGTPTKRGPGDWVFVGTAGKQYPMAWRHTKGGYRAPRPWAEPAMRQVQPSFVRRVNAAVARVMTFQE